MIADRSTHSRFASVKPRLASRGRTRTWGTTVFIPCSNKNANRLDSGQPRVFLASLRRCFSRLTFFACEADFAFAGVRELAFLAGVPALAEDAAALVDLAVGRSALGVDLLSLLKEGLRCGLSSDCSEFSPTKSVTLEATVPRADPTLRATFDNALSCSAFLVAIIPPSAAARMKLPKAIGRQVIGSRVSR